MRPNLRQQLNSCIAVRNQKLRFLNASRTETTGTDPKALSHTVYQRPNGLQVGAKHPLGFIIRMTDVMAGHAFFSTNRTCKRHGERSFHSVGRDEIAQLQDTIAEVDTFVTIPVIRLTSLPVDFPRSGRKC